MKTKKKSHDPAPASPRYYNLTKIYIYGWFPRQSNDYIDELMIMNDKRKKKLPEFVCIYHQDTFYVLLMTEWKKRIYIKID